MHLSENTWKKIDFDYSVTTNTVLEFDFKSTAQGEVQAIGFDSDNTLSHNQTFALYGTQNWGLTGEKTYAATAGDWVHYSIDVGDYYTGDFSNIFFANDHDVSNPTAESFFRNVKVHEVVPIDPESIDFTTQTILSYGGAGQDISNVFAVEDNGATLHLSENTWKKIDFDYSVTTNTVLEFDFKSTAQGEVQAIGFDSDNALSHNQTFALYGTQNWGLTGEKTYAATAGDWVHYSIDVGDYYTGDFSNIFFANDHDVSNPTAESFFRNVTVSESNGIYGNDADNTLSGTSGADYLYGNDGADTFLFEVITAFDAVDTIGDFDLIEGDKLDLSDLLEGFDPLNDLITDFVQIVDSGSNSIVSVDANGGGDNFQQIAQISNVTGLTDEDALVTNGTLIV